MAVAAAAEAAAVAAVAVAAAVAKAANGAAAAGRPIQKRESDEETSWEGVTLEAAGGVGGRRHCWTAHCSL